MTVIDETLLEAQETMEQVIAGCRSDLIGLGTGRASAGSFARIVVDLDGTMTLIPLLASVAVAEARIAVIKPYDVSQIGAVEQAIRASDLGVNPTNDGSSIRVLFPQLTATRHRDLAKVAKTRGEDTKVSVRSVARHASETIAKLSEEGTVAEDDARRAESELQKLTERYVASIDDLVKHMFG